MSDYLPYDLFAELEARQDELIVQLDHLNDKIEAALLEYAPASRTESDEDISFRKAS
ncbi:MAG: hypothetical protein JW829_13120 [Pirellulales bacterium]|nr:hypothetical protein [Pirellulales bacterium]